MGLETKDIEKEKLSLGMRQYMGFKKKHLHDIVMFRLGDFYEMFFEDAVIASQELNLTLTGKDCGLSERAPMCGVPHHAREQYVRTLVENGHTVVIVEQIEDPSQAKGIVKRDVMRIITPGTVIDDSMLDVNANNWLCCIQIYPPDKDYNGASAAVFFADISTGEINLFRIPKENLQNGIIECLSRFMPSEIITHDPLSDLKDVKKYILKDLLRLPKFLTNREFEPRSFETVLKMFSVKSIEEIGLKLSDPAIWGLNALCGYLEETLRMDVRCFSGLNLNEGEQIMRLGVTARTNLELERTLKGEKKYTLYWVLNKTVTSMGRRMLSRYIDQPLLSPYKIMSRLDAVEELSKSGPALGGMRDILTGIRDMERLMTRVIYRSAAQSDLLALASSCDNLPKLKEMLTGFNSKLLAELNAEISPLDEIAEKIKNTLSDDPETVKDGVGIIKSGCNEEIDKNRRLIEDTDSYLEEYVKSERDRTGIRNLKYGYNRVFGYYLEVTRSFYEFIPEDYQRKQTLANCERFVTNELMGIEKNIQSATAAISKLESEIYSGLLDFVSERLPEVKATASAIGNLDVLMSFAQCALENNYCKPEIAIDGIINIKNGRHPVVELTMKDELFVPNDTYLDTGDNRMSIITGPNMSGKSTYMRQVALITLMAQIGSFVPADYAKISVVDQIFTRVGASDDLASGQSTFMTEMSEVAEIVKNATRNSLVILDEVGRGTSTRDGISIAQSVAEYIADPKLIGCKTLFATHYHELISLEGSIPGAVNYSVAVKRSRDGVRFLRKIVRGGTDESYGIEVAKLAGLPKKLTDRANEILSEIDKKSEPQKNPEDQITFDGIGQSAAIGRLKQLSIDELSDDELREQIKDIVKSI